MTRKTKCERGIHKFEPRYDEKPYPGPVEAETTGSLRRLLYYDIYIYDICVRCGKIVNRKEARQ